MDRVTSINLNEAVAKLHQTEAQVMELGRRMFSADDGKMFPVDLVAVAALKRTSGNTEGFLTLIQAKNMSAARSLLRIQLDTFIRFSSIWLVDEPHNYATEILKGKHIRNIKDKNNQKMTDRYLVDTLADKYSWLSNVYSNLCGYVHFSGQHIYNSVDKLNEKDRTITFHIGKEDHQYPECSWIEAVDCFTTSVNILFYYLEGWIETKNGANTANK